MKIHLNYTSLRFIDVNADSGCVQDVVLKKELFWDLIDGHILDMCILA